MESEYATDKRSGPPVVKARVTVSILTDFLKKREHISKNSILYSAFALVRQDPHL